MDLTTHRAITRPHVTPVPITPVAIRSVEEMARKEGIKTLKLMNRHGNIFPSDHLTGVGENNNGDVQDDESNGSKSSDSEDSEDSSEGSTDSKDSKDADAEEIEDEIKDEEDFEPVDRNALYDVLAEDRPSRRVSKVITADEDDDVPDLREQEDDGSDDEDEDVPEPAPQRSTRTKRMPERYCAATIKMKAKDRMVKRPTSESYVEDQASRMMTKGRVLFEHDNEYEMETKYNLHGSATKDNTLEYEGYEAYVIAGMISEINLRTTVDGKDFAQQYMLKKGLEKFGNKG